MKLSVLLIALLFIPGLLNAQSPRNAGGEASVRAVTTEGGITLRVEGIKAGVSAGKGGAVVTHNAGSFLLPGDSSALPALAVTLGVPYDARDIRVELVSVSGRDTLGSPALLGALPAAKERPDVSVGMPREFRGLRMVSVQYRPLRLVGGSLVVDRSAVLSVTWNRSGGISTKESIRELPELEANLRSLVLNFDDAKKWRVSGSRGGAATMSAITGGMGGAMVLLIPEDGLYRLDVSAVAAAGGSEIIGRPIADLRLRRRNVSIPVHVGDAGGDGVLDGNDVIEFRGRRNESPEGLYYDETTDTNSYILTWNGGSGPGPEIRAGAVPATDRILRGYDSTLHIEEENIYYWGRRLDGTDIRTVHFAERVPSERFYWTDISHDERFPTPVFVPFDCSPRYEPNGKARIRVRLTGVTETAHVMALSLNKETILDTVLLASDADTVLEFIVPVYYLLNGRNELRIDALDPGGHVPNTMNLDWVEVEGRWQPSADGPGAEFRLPPDASGPYRVDIAGLTDEPRIALSGKSRVTVDSVRSGLRFRVTSRQFPPGERHNPGFAAEIGDNRYRSTPWEFGINILEVNGSDGSIRRSRAFNLYNISASDVEARFRDAVTFVNEIPTGNYVIAGFSTGGSDLGGPYDGKLPKEFIDLFRSLGSRNLDPDRVYVASWAFVARKGEPASAVEAYEQFVDLGVTPGVSLDAFLPIDASSSNPLAVYRASLRVEGAPGEEFRLAQYRSPILRWHPADSLMSTENQADMIIITHPKFMAESRRLAAFRAERRGLKVKVVDVHTIYDEFNDGIKSAYAIRRFLQYADESWAQPKPLYILIVGDASWDAQMRIPTSKMVDYVPTMGNHVSDYLMTVHVGDTTMQSNTYIGRLPVSTEQEARNVIDKLVTYEDLEPDFWNKRYVFLAGGGNDDAYMFRMQSEALAEFPLFPQFAGDTAVVFRTGADLTYPDTKDAEWARAEINKGTLWATFTGHGAIDIFDLNFGYPEELDNGDRYFVLGTYSCQTGAFAEPSLINRNERFLLYPGKGAIAAFGGTSYSYIEQDVAIKSNLLVDMTEQFERNLGALISKAKMKMFLQNADPNTWHGSLGGIVARNLLTMYNLLGDPTTNLPLRGTVELAVREGAQPIRNSAGEPPTVRDTVALVPVRLWDFGRPVPSGETVTVRASITDRTGVSRYDTLTLNGLGYYRDTIMTLPLGGEPGEYAVRIEIDPEGRFSETYLGDNVLTLTLRVRGNQPLPIEPLPNGRVPGYDDVVVRLLNPTAGPGAEILVDTTARFDSPARVDSRRTGSMKLEELITTWTFSIPQELRSARTFYWRAVSTAGDTSVGNLFPLIETFTVDPTGGVEYIVRGRSQFEGLEPAELVVDEKGIGPGAVKVPVHIMSIGQTKAIGEQQIKIQKTVTMRIGSEGSGRDYTGGRDAGVNVLVLPPNDIRPARYRVYYYYDGNVGERFHQFRDFVRDSIAEGERVFVAFSMEIYDPGVDVDGSRMGSLREGLKLLGSRYADSMGKEDSYILMGGKRVPPREVWVNGDSLRQFENEPNGQAPWPAYLNDTIDAVPSGRIAFPVVGPATDWKTLSFSHEGAPADAFVIGIRRDGTRDTVIREKATTGPISLDSINPLIYPRITVATAFSQDPAQRIGSVDVAFDPSPELAIVPSTVDMTPDSVLQGDAASLDVSVINLSRKYTAENFMVRLTEIRESLEVPVDSVRIERLAPDDSSRRSLRITTDRLKGFNTFQATVNPWAAPMEPYLQNNTVSGRLKVLEDQTPPKHAFYADATRLITGDYVSPQPQFEIRIFDDSFLALDSISAVRVYIDDTVNIESGSPFWTSWGARLEMIPQGSGEVDRQGHRASFLFRPPADLDAGLHTAIFYIEDFSGNETRSEVYEFYVERNLGVQQVLNVPNPFQTKTTFTFVVTGAEQPTSGEIGVFTVAGRKIKTIELDPSNLHIGFNRILWDGLDEDGDRLANGVYYYRVTVKGADGTQEAIQKLVVMR